MRAVNKKPESEHPEDRKGRDCLMCRESFLSTWAGERVCPKCKTKSAWREGRDWLPGGRAA